MKRVNPLCLFVLLGCFLLLPISDAVALTPLEQATREATKYPEDVRVQSLLARAYNEDGQYSKALWVAKAVLGKKPGYPAALLEFAHANRFLGNHEEAVKAYHAYLGTNPLSLEGQVGNSESLAHLGSWDEAFSSARVIINAHPKNSGGYEALGRAYRLAGRPDEAVGLLNQGLSFDPGNKRILYELGLCYTELGDQSSALAQYEKLLDRDEKMAQKLFQIIYP